MRFSTDGAVPTLNSPVLKAENIINPGTAITIKTFFAQDSFNKTLSVPFKTGTAFVAQDKPARAVSGAWNYKVYSDSAMHHVLRSGILAENTNLNQMNDTNNFYCRISGFLETEKEGYYIFEMAGKAKLYINDQLLMQTDNYKSFIVPLKKGFYPVRFEFSHTKSGSNFDFGYKLPDEKGDGPIPMKLMYYLPK